MLARRSLLLLAALAGGCAVTVENDGPSNAAPRPYVEHYPTPAIPGGAPAPFSSAVRVGDVLWLSGAIGVDANRQLPAGMEAQARQTMDNVGAALRAAGLAFDDVFHCTVMLDDMRQWGDFNRVYVTYFTPGRLPARSALGADGLALGALVEVECQAYAGNRR
ncbi:MAG: RidA family protein [Sphingosinicella sp.]